MTQSSADQMIQQNRNQLEEFARMLLAEIEKKDQYPNNLHLIVQYADGVSQYANVLDSQEKKKKGIPTL